MTTRAKPRPKPRQKKKPPLRPADLDRIYEPEQFNQLARDLVAARGTPLKPYEDGSLRRWKREGRDCRIRRLNDGQLTCWPIELPDRPEQSYINGRPTSPHAAMSFLRGDSDYGVSVGIRFDKTDIDLLRAAALVEKNPRHKKQFQEAISSIERDSLLVVRVMTEQELHDLMARFMQAGIAHVTFENLRVGKQSPIRV